MRYAIEASDPGNYRLVGNPTLDLLSLTNEPPKGQAANLWYIRHRVAVEEYELYLTLFVAARQIASGEELLVSYGPEFPRDYEVGSKPVGREPDVVDIEFDQFCHVQGIDSVAVALSYGAISSKDMSKEQTPSSDIKKFVAKIMSMNLNARRKAENSRTGPSQGNPGQMCNRMFALHHAIRH